MKTRGWFWGAGTALSILLLAGCGATLSPIEQRIQQEYAFFAELPEDTQARLRSGRFEIGDSTDAARIVYGEPTRVYDRLTETSANVVWSYSSSEMTPVDQFEQVHYPVVGRHGRTSMASDFLLQRSYLHRRNEFVRIEFRDGKVIAIDFIGKPE